MPTTRWMTVAATGLALAACSVRKDGDAQPSNVAETAGEGVTREPVAAPTAAPVAVQAPVIQSQAGPKGNTVALNKVAVTGDILTVSMTFSGSGDCCVHVPLDQVSVIDDATSQRISVLKDNAGQYLASPLESDGRNVQPDSWQKPSIVWFKFPAPPATSRTVSITIPGAAPFDAVPVTR